MEQLLNEEVCEIIYQDYLSMHQISDGILDRMKQEMSKDYDEISYETYQKLMYMRGIRYEQDDNKNAARYCALRMMQVKDGRNARKKSSYLNYNEYEIDDDMDGFINRYSEFLDEVYRKMYHSLTLITLIVFALMFFVLLFLLQFNFFFAFFESILLGMLNYFIQKKRMPNVFMKKQLKAIERYCDNDLLKFDEKIYYI